MFKLMNKKKSQFLYSKHLLIWTFESEIVRMILIFKGLQIRVGIGKIFSLFLSQNTCCGSQKKRLKEMVLFSTKTYV